MLQVAAKLHPESIEIPLRLALTLIQAGEYAEAESCLTAVESRSLGDWRVHWYQGLSLLYQGPASSASAAFDRVYSELPGEPAAKLALALSAELSVDLGNRDAVAIRLYDLVSRTDPAFATAAFGLARAWDVPAAVPKRRRPTGAVPQTSSLYVRAQTALARAWLA